MNFKKEINYANRGMWLENIINDSNEYYKSKDIAVIYKKPTPIKILNVKYRTKETTLIDKAVFSGISTLDYNGVYKGKYIEFDAKETKSKTNFPLSNIQHHQIDHIKKVLKQNGIIFIIIFINNNFYLLSGYNLINFINNNTRKSIPLSYIIENGYLIKEKYIPRLDYIIEVDKLIKGEYDAKNKN